ncbi:MAG: hypothetical protein K8R48_06410 [Alphaproteobacteria bacterium]|nr:hypothetical protein [Alphaproteobacteria bacterium]
MKKAIYFFSIFTICLACLFSYASFADKGSPHGKKGIAASPKHENSSLLRAEDREIINTFLAERKQSGLRHCPPGLAKKNNGCLPPGIAKKYSIGNRLPDDAEVLPLPEELLRRLLPPTGYYYGQVDGDVVLISEATKNVIDAVTLLSSIGK